MGDRVGASQPRPGRRLSGSGSLQMLVRHSGLSLWGRPARALLAVLLIALVTTGGISIAGTASADAAAPVLGATPASPGNDTTPTWQFSATGPVECSLVTPVTAPPVFGDCTTATSFTAPALGDDGDYRFAVREQTATDDAPQSTSDYTLDTTVELVVTSPPSPSRDRSLHWGIALEPGATATCSLDGASPVSCDTGYDADLTGAADGTSHLVVRATDAVGNTATKTLDHVLDTTAPAAPVVSGTSGDTSDPQVLWTWAEQAGDTAACTLVGPSGAGAPEACSSPHPATLVADGAWHLEVALTDAAGNAGPSGQGPEVRLDRVAPTAPVITRTPASPSRDTSPSWDLQTDGEPSTCVLTGSTRGAQPGTACSTTFSQALPGDDSWTLTVTTTDAAGNSSRTTSPAYVLDTTGPTAPAVDGPSGPARDTSPTWSWTGEADSSAECRLVSEPGDQQVAPWASCNSPFQQVLPADSTYRVQVRLTDALGNTGGVGQSGPYVLDTTPPATPTVTGPASPGKDATPVFTFTPEQGASADCQLLTGGRVADAQPCTSGRYAPTLPADGDYRVLVTVTDPAGNTSTAGERDYTLDTTAPDAAQVLGPQSPGAGRSPQWQVTGAGPFSCQLFQDGTAVTELTSCGSTYYADLTSASDGSYRLDVSTTDAAGNTATTSSTYVLDTVAPAAPVVTGPPSPGNGASPAWTFPPEAGTTATCRLTQGVLYGSFSDCSSGTYLPALPGDGTYTVDVLVTDAAGNVAPLASSAPYVSDRTAPGAPVVSGPSGSSNVASATWTWTGEAGASAQCRLDRDGQAGSYQPCSGGTASPALSGDATYVLDVTLTDAAGNTSSAGSSAPYVLDTVAPAAPVVTGPTGLGRSTAPVWSWTSEPGTSATCRVVRDGTYAAWAPCTSGSPQGLSGDASYVLQVQLTDAAGNTGAPGSSGTYVLDTTAPDAPAVTTPASPTNVGTPSWTWPAESGSTSQCRLSRGGTLVQDWTTCTSPFTDDLSAPSSPAANDGSYVLDVRVVDRAGNTSATGSALPFVLDTVAPAAAVVDGPSGPSHDAQPSFTFTSEPGATTRCRLDLAGAAVGAPTTGATVPCTSPYVPTLTSDGTWTLRVRVTDAAGNVATTLGSSPAYVFDSTPPAAPVVTPSAPTGRALRPVWSGTAEAGATTTCQLSGGALGTQAPVACTLPWTSDLTGGGDATYTVSVVATDAAGNQGPAGQGTYVLDTGAPDAPVWQPVAAQPSRNRAPSFGYTVETGASVQCRVDGAGGAAAVVGSWTACTSPVRLDLTAGGAATYPDGTYTLSGRATDGAGNVSATSSVTYVLDTTAPAAPVLQTAPASPSPDRTPTWEFAAEAGATLDCRVTNSAGAVVAAGACTSPYVLALPASQADDTLTLAVRATDAAGNASPPLTSAFALSSSAVATPDVTGPMSPGQSTTPHWSVTAPSGTPQCRLSKGLNPAAAGTALREWATCPSTGFSASLASSGDGPYVLEVRDVDGALTPSAVVVSHYVLDTTPPAPATVTAPLTPSTNRHPAWSVSSSEPSVTALCTLTRPDGYSTGQTGCDASPAGSAYTVDLTGLPDGAYTLSVVLRDLAGNSSSAVSSTYLLDSVAPGPVTITSPATPGNSPAPVWQLAGDADATLQCRLTSPSGTLSDWSSCAPAQPPAPGKGLFVGALTDEGSYTLTSRSTDAAGNVGPETTSTYVYDHTAPATAAVQVSPVGPSSTATPSWTFTLPAGAHGVCQLLRDNVLLQDSFACTSPYHPDLSSTGDGSYDLSVRAVDDAGNASAPAAVRYVYDSTPPAAPLITSGPPTRGASRDVSWTVLPSDKTDTVQCRLVVNGSPQDWAPCAAPQHYLLSSYTDGVFLLQVQEIDAAGNTSPTVSSTPYTLDLDAPPFATVVPPVPPEGRASLIAFTVTRAADDNDTDHLLCSVTTQGGTAAVTTCGFGTTTVDVSGAADGPVVLSVQTVDALGNTGAPYTASYVRDTTPPPPPVVTSLQQQSLEPADTWTWTDAGASSFQCTLTRDGSVVTTSAPSVLPGGSCSSPLTLALPAKLTGTWSLAVSGLDDSGNPSAAGTAAFVYLPKVPLPAVKGPATGKDAAPKWTFSPSSGWQATCQLSRQGQSTKPQGCTSPAQLRLSDLEPTPSNGTYTFTVTLHDAYGDAGPPASAAYTYSGVQPVLAPVSPIVPPATPPATSPPRHPVTGQLPPSRTPSAPSTSQTPPARTTPVPARTNADPLPKHGLALNPVATGGAGSGGKKSQASPRVPGSDRGIFESPPSVQAIGHLAQETIRRPAVPIVLLVVVIVFLVVQSRMDRRDPKLASAPVGAEPELDFGPVLGKGTGWETGPWGQGQVGT